MDKLDHTSGGAIGGVAFGVWRLAFGVWRLAFVRSAFGVRRSAFGVRRSAFGFWWGEAPEGTDGCSEGSGDPRPMYCWALKRAEPWFIMGHGSARFPAWLAS